MAYIALYRAFRPKQFREIVGQNHISLTLKNAVITDRVAHAYLFCGPRGTGKTSTAKVLAKAINCLEGEQGEPCNQCNICQAVNDNLSYDIIEIDGASNRGIDEIRDLKEKVKLAPAEAQYKVYIIDEVHMLTTEAFNALLKTLEEPPSHVVFILATTEPHKVPLTILSRCQRFDFHRMSAQVILDHLAKICADSKISIQPEALYTIARAADGGMRDALSILDQAITFGGDEVTLENVALVVGAVKDQVLLEFAQAVAARDSGTVLELINQADIAGIDMGQLVWGLLEHFRNLMLIKSGETQQLVTTYSELHQQLIQQEKDFSLDQLFQIIEILATLEKELKWSNSPKILVEVAAIKLCRGLGGVSLEALQHRISQLEQQVAQGNISQPQPSQVGQIKEEYQVHKANKTYNEKPKANEAHETYEKHEVNEANEANEANEVNEVSEVSEVNEANLELVTAKWKEVLQQVKKVSVATHAFLVEGKPASFQDNKLLLVFGDGYSFHCEKLEQLDNKKLIEQVLTKVLQCPVAIACKLNSALQNSQGKDGFAQDVDKAIQMFGADMVEIKDKKK